MPTSEDRQIIHDGKIVRTFRVIQFSREVNQTRLSAAFRLLKESKNEGRDFSIDPMRNALFVSGRKENRNCNPSNPALALKGARP